MCHGPETEEKRIAVVREKRITEEAEELAEGDVISYAVVAEVNGPHELEETECPLGRLAVEWIR